MEMRDALQQLKSSGNDPESVEACIRTLFKIGENACQHWNPTTKKHLRTIKGNSAALRKKIMEVPGGFECFLALGFTKSPSEEDGETLWCITDNAQAVEKCWESYAVLRDELMSGSSIPVDEAKSKAANEGGGIEGTIRDMLTSPAKLNQILQNPVFRQMISSNPDLVEGFASSVPQIRETLTIYPEMRTRLESVIGRPLRIEGSAAVSVSPSGNGASDTPPSAPLPPALPAAHAEGIVALLMDMGFPADRCRDAAASSGGDIDTAVALLAGD